MKEGGWVGSGEAIQIAGKKEMRRWKETVVWRIKMITGTHDKCDFS